MDSEPEAGNAGALLDTARDRVVDLCGALSMRIAEAAGCRALIIKGPALAHHGLRREHVSADLDVLVEPAGAQRYLTAALVADWHPRQPTSGGARLKAHSVTLTNEGWPIDLDVHAAFPGILAQPDDAFEFLWRGRTEVILAGVPCWIPSREASLAIWALHSLRGTVMQPRHAQELRQIVEFVLPGLRGAERRALAECVVELAADEPLRAVPAFADLIGNRRGAQAPGAVAEWRRKVEQSKDASYWLQVLREAAVRDRPRLLIQSLWPSASELRLMDEHFVDTPLGRVQSRGRRAWRLVRRIVERRRQAH